MKMMVKKLLGDLVKEERLRRNLSQNALAENVHVSLRTISDIENYNANGTFLLLFINLLLSRKTRAEYSGLPVSIIFKTFYLTDLCTNHNIDHQFL